MSMATRHGCGLDALAAKLRQIAIPGEVVGVLLPTSVGATATSFALISAGCTLAMLNITNAWSETQPSIGFKPATSKT